MKKETGPFGSWAFYESWIEDELANPSSDKERLAIDNALFEVKSALDYDNGRPGYVKFSLAVDYQERAKSFFMLQPGFKWKATGKICRVSWGTE